MIIAVITVTMVQSPIDQIIEVIAMRDQRMSAPIMPALTGHRCASGGIFGAHGNHVLVVMVFVWMVQMPVVEIVYVSIVENAQMPAVLAVNVRMRIVDGMCHRTPPFLEQILRLILRII